MRSIGIQFHSRLISLLSAFLAAALLGVGGCPTDDPATPPQDFDRTVILISVDGFRPDYLDRVDTPNIDRLIAGGVSAGEGMFPVYPSVTFPNHYSIVTGLYPAGHGIVSNTMYDPELGETFRITDRDAITDPRWWGGEPLWVTAENQDVISATYFWVGSEAPVGGVQPTYWFPYDSSVPGRVRVDTALEWLDLPPDERPGFISLYFSDVDHFGHEDGPGAVSVDAAVREIDDHIGRLLRGLDERGLKDGVNIILVSDHGMAPISSDRVIFLDDYINLDDVYPVDVYSTLGLNLRPGRGDDVFEALDGAHPELQVWRRGDMPERFHYAGHRRIPEIVGMAGEGWMIVRERAWLEENPSRISGGAHGYDNRAASMRALFVAHGPAFRDGVTAEPFENIHLYEAMAAILGVTPAANDGDLSVLAPYLESHVLQE